MAQLAPKMHRLYIHVPFCSRKCDYCAFYSEPSPSADLIQSYLNRIEQEFAANAGLCSELDSIYIGGGTPSLLNGRQLGKLIEGIVANFAISKDAEISIECNPESLNPENVSIIANFANRISLGVQSFNCEFRKTIGRRGEIGETIQAIDLLTSHGLDNIGCDLIYAIPGETMSDWENELKQAISLPIKHISAYSLTFEEGTQLSQKNLVGPKDFTSAIHLENEAGMWELAGEFLNANGFPRYEISNYSQPAYECQHNDKIWFGDTFLGCGPAAASFDGNDRWTNPNSIQSWLEGEKAEIDKITPEKRAREIFVMGLRTVKGWNRQDFTTVSGFDWGQWTDDLQILTKNDLLKISPENIKCSDKGLLLWNEIAERLI